MYKERIKGVDTLKGIGILLVLIAHAGIPHALTSLIYIFHMPLFIAISGYLFSNDHKIRISKKAKSLLWPYFTFSIINIVYWLLLKTIAGTLNMNVIKELLVSTIFGTKVYDTNYIGTLWYLLALFFVELICMTIYKYFEYREGTIIIVAMSLLSCFITPLLNHRMPFMIDTAFGIMSFFTVGVCLRQITDNNKCTLRQFIVATIGGG